MESFDPSEKMKYRAHKQMNEKYKKTDQEIQLV